MRAAEPSHAREVLVFGAGSQLQLSAGGQVGPQTDWDSYKNRSFTSSVDQHLIDPALIGAIDLHAHCDPDSYPRQADSAAKKAPWKKEGKRRHRCSIWGT